MFPKPTRRTVSDLLDGAAWARVEPMITTRKPAGYDAATALLADLKALAERHEGSATFAVRLAALRRTHTRKPTLIENSRAVHLN
ncbi:hypothetical protein [Amycolatopsis sp. NPDC059657]|uniref:hypothetical protein n=1 Tax=Amycolatopsis sp. NPDC059657 TaxID=3346899 RepID=UPI00366B07AC